MSLLAGIAVLALATRPALAYSCSYDYYNNYNCNNFLSNGARIGIGIGIALLVILLLVCVTYTRRRRLRAANAAYLQQQAANPGQYGPSYAPPPPQQQQGWGWGYGMNGPRQGQGFSTRSPANPGNVELENGVGVGTGVQGGPEYAPPPPAYDAGGATYPPKTYAGQGGYQPPAGAPPPTTENGYDPTNAQNYPNRR